MSNYHGHEFNLEIRNNSWSHIFGYIKKGSKVLDVGCSNGNFGAALRELKGCHVTGIDIDKDDVEIAKKNLDKAYLMDVDKSDLSKLGKFNYVIFADVIEHLISPRETLKRITEVLTKDGKILFSIPHMGHISVRLDLLEGKFPYKDRGLLDKTHLHFYDAAEVESVFSDAGLIIDNMQPTIATLPKGMLRSRLKKLGLEMDDTFLKSAEQNMANIFQFVGSAKAEPEQHRQAAPKELDYVMPQDEISEYAKSLENELQTLRGEVESLRSADTELRLKLKNIPRRRLLKKMIFRDHPIA